MSETVKTIGIVGSAHDESLKAMAEFNSHDAVRFLLFGDAAETERRAKELGIDIGGIPLVHSADEAESCRTAAIAARDGQIQVLMKGSVHTADFLRALLDKELGLMEEGNLLSHVAKLDLPWYPKPLLLSDAAVSILPDLDTKVQIIGNAVKVARSIGIISPKVALVCPVETVNPRIVSTTDAQQIVFLQTNTAVFGDAQVEGPFGLDVALSSQAAQTKGITGSVPGAADLLVFGNLDAANATYKAFLCMPDVVSAGIVVGARLPVVLTSRSETMRTRAESISLALTVSQ